MGVNWTGDVDDNDTDDEPTGDTSLADSVAEDIAVKDDEAAEVAADAVDPADDQTPTEDNESDEPAAEAADGDGETGAVADDEGTDESPDDAGEATDDDVAAAIADAATAVTNGETTPEPPEALPDEEAVPEPVTTTSDPSGTYLADAFLDDYAPNAITRDEATEADERWTFLVWGDEGTGKSHFAHTAPEPVMYLDTEAKASNLAGKFDREVVYFNATDYDKARAALVQALDVLEQVQSAHGVTGSIVVDSMSRLWEFAQQKHVDEHYLSAETPEDVEFKSGLQGGNDWQKIKKYHNARFRDVLADCPYHVVLTAMAEEDYNAVLEGDEGKPMKPQGEKNNRYAVENIVRLRADPSGETVGDLMKTDRTRFRFQGMAWPTFRDAVSAIQSVARAEQADPTDLPTIRVSDQAVQVVRGSPSVDGGEDDE